MEEIEIDKKITLEIDKEPVISLEVAESFFDDWADSMDLELDENFMDHDDLGQYRKQKKRLVSGFMRGALRINDKSEMVFTPENPKSRYKDPITFHERTGASVMAMDGRKKGHDVNKMYAVMADMCRIQVKDFAGMQGRDIKICEAICTLLMD